MIELEGLTKRYGEKMAVNHLTFTVRPEVRADLVHGLLRAGQHGVGERFLPVPGDEDQVDVKVVDDVTARAYVRVWVPSW